MITNQTPFIYSPSQQYLFGRAYAVSIGTPGQSSALQYGTIGNNPAPLRVRFDIDKNSIGASNKAKIELYNLAAQTRQAIKKGYVIQLQVGYNSLIDTVFIGNVINTKSDRNGPDIITSLECGDGESAITYSVLDKSYPAGTTLVQILQDTAKAMSLGNPTNPVGINSGIAVGIPNQVFNKGFIAHGPCKDTLDKLLIPQGLEWSIQNGNLNIIPITNYNGQNAIVVSSSTGMIGVPSKNEFFLIFEHLINPKIVPGALIQMVSENAALNGFNKIKRSHFEGDSHDQKWQISCEATSMPNITQNLALAQGFNYSPAAVP